MSKRIERTCVERLCRFCIPSYFSTAHLAVQALQSTPLQANCSTLRLASTVHSPSFCTLQATIHMDYRFHALSVICPMHVSHTVRVAYAICHNVRCHTAYTAYSVSLSFSAGSAAKSAGESLQATSGDSASRHAGRLVRLSVRPYRASRSHTAPAPTTKATTTLGRTAGLSSVARRFRRLRNVDVQALGASDKSALETAGVEFVHRVCNKLTSISET